MRPRPIQCSDCCQPTGAYFVDGDPYLPSIVCEEYADCREDDEAEDDEA